MLAPFPWYGGKQLHLPFLLRHLPPTVSARTHFVDVFGGSGAVALNCPYTRVTYNDVDYRVVDFFRTLRENTDELVEQLLLTPHAREELYRCSKEGEEDPIENARRFYVRARQVINGLVNRADDRYWKYRVDPAHGTCGLEWTNSIYRLRELAVKIRTWQIECRPALRILETYDHRDTVFYCDPPYPASSRSACNHGYEHEMTDKDHEELLHALVSVDAKVMVSSYPNKMYDDALQSFWKHMDKSRSLPAANQASSKTEVVWCNYQQINELFANDH